MSDRAFVIPKGMTELRAVRAQLDDLDALAPLFDGYRRFYDQPSDLDGARAFLAERIKRSESVIFLAVRDRTIVGFTQLYPSFSSVSMQKLWVLNDRGDRREGPHPGHPAHEPHGAAALRSVRLVEG